MRLAGHVVLIVREIRNAYAILAMKPDEKKPLGRCKCRWDDNSETTEARGD
jgi:hypothetical protein